MKLLALGLISTLFLSNQVFAKSLLTSCKATVLFPEDSQTMSESKYDIKVFEDKNGKVFSEYTMTVAGMEVPNIEDAQVHTDIPVNQEILADPYQNDLNIAERMVSHAISVTEEEELGEIFKVSVPLKEITSATVYTIGEHTKFGGLALIEGKNKDGKSLGTYLGGFLVADCE